ncbi:hypothetical protein CPter291_2131 [Collimonas pratensis]|uniref:Transposase n=1 Tax=Collimonas pratensis TaxID=279113 RepID=A0ABM5Z5P3_9BURK|nr:hypothetical protein CPter291_2131 [Collimonas pratensis]
MTRNAKNLTIHAMIKSSFGRCRSYTNDFKRKHFSINFLMATIF